MLLRSWNFNLTDYYTDYSIDLYTIYMYIVYTDYNTLLYRPTDFKFC